MITDIWIATGNEGKLKEISLILDPAFPKVTLHHQNELPGFTARPENGKTYLENARIKTKTLKSVRDKDWVLGEDSGIEVLGLGGLPGIHSARYAGDKAQDSENTTKLLKMMSIRGVTDRSARFVCCLIVYTPDGQEWIFEAEMKGQIAKAPAGLHGFGYDPIFIPEGNSQTLAEIGPSYKMTHSHRTKALKAFIEKVKTL